MLFGLRRALNVHSHTLFPARRQSFGSIVTAFASMHCDSRSNGVFCEGVSPREFLARFPRSIYTTVKVSNSEAIDIVIHVSRLTRNLRLAIDNGQFPHLKKHRDSLFPLVAHSISDELRKLTKDAQKVDPSSALVIVLSSLPPDDTRAREGLLHVAALLAPFPELDLVTAGKRRVQAYVVGLARTLAAIKDTDWVLDRKPLSAQLPKDAIEGLLQTADGCLLEGLVTNLFVLSTTAPDSKPQLQTAPVDLVLEGISRVKVLQACKDLDIEVVEKAPDWRERSSWREAFLCNCLRSLQPIGSIQCRPGNTPSGIEPWEVSLGTSCGQTTELLRHAVLARMVSTPLRELPDVVRSCQESSELSCSGAA